MRNLKKTLCMVLALVFVLGLCTVGVGAVNGTEFSDQEEINYTTAVKAMSGLGILKGDDNDGDGENEFRPADPVKRAEAAKIIAYVNVGEEVEKWPARQVFDDVPADHWAAKYVTYCQYNNIIAGYGNGKFGPDDPVTQAQLAKMLLSCCGYGVKDEFIGEGWDQNVAKVAFQTKVLKGILSTDWDGPATREETALLAYNTMMSVVQVALSKDTNSYEPIFINGVQGVTLSQSTWELIPIKGIVEENKANEPTAKGTKIAYDYDPTTATIWEVVLETEDDENPDILGHEVTVMYRVEGVAPNFKNVAYYIDDSCEEVTGAEANTADYADLTANVYNGGVAVGIGAPGLDAGKNVRYRDLDSTYVLNAEGKLVSVKFSDYYIAPLTIDFVTKIATVTGPAGGASNREVVAPEGAVSGDIVTVYQCGAVYTVKATTREEKVAITQANIVSYTDYTVVPPFTTYSFSYNDGELLPSDATNLGPANMAAVLAKINAFGIDAERAPKPALGDELKVGYSYTLYFDAEGGIFAYSDEVLTSEVAIADYAVVICRYGPVDDSYGAPHFYYQLVKADGSVLNVEAPTAAEFATNPTRGDVVKVSSYTQADVDAGTVPASAKGKAKLIAAPAATLTTSGAVSREAYNPVPTLDFSNAKFIYIGPNETRGDLKPTVGGTPFLRSATDAVPSEISYTCRKMKSGTVEVTIVDTVWYTKKAVEDKNIANSYIYVINSDVKEEKLVNDVKTPFYNGYKDGTAMSDLRLADGKAAPAVGFYRYTEKDGVYTLTAVDPGDGTKSGARDVYLVDGDTTGAFIMGSTLYVRDNVGTAKAIDLTNVKVVRVANTADAAALKYVAIDSVAAIQSVLLTKNVTPSYKVEISFVEVVDAYGVHSAGSGVIYVVYAGQ